MLVYPHSTSYLHFHSYRHFFCIFLTFFHASGTAITHTGLCSRRRRRSVGTNLYSSHPRSSSIIESKSHFLSNFLSLCASCPRTPFFPLCVSAPLQPVGLNPIRSTEPMCVSDRRFDTDILPSKFFLSFNLYLLGLTRATHALLWHYWNQRESLTT
jgi:hypothetical protein